MGTVAWRCNPAIEVHWRDWGDASVAFESRSGETHLFDAFSAAVYACIESGANDESSLISALSDDMGGAWSSAAAQSLAAVLERLLRLGWIETITAQ
jgi:PqqD family protein of HPr-rel-A system